VVAAIMFLANKKTRLYTLGCLLVAALFFVFSPALRGVLNSVFRDLFGSKLLLNDYSGMIRRLIWSETWVMLKDHWFFGAGLAGYPLAIIPYHIHKFEIFPDPHNIFLNFWSETGILGLIAFGWLSIKYIWLSLKDIFCIETKCGNTFSFHKVASCVFLAVALEIVIHGLVDVPYFKNDLSVLVWLLVAVASLNFKLKEG